MEDTVLKEVHNCYFVFKIKTQGRYSFKGSKQLLTMECQSLFSQIENHFYNTGYKASQDSSIVEQTKFGKEKIFLLFLWLTFFMFFNFVCTFNKNLATSFRITPTIRPICKKPTSKTKHSVCCWWVNHFTTTFNEVRVLSHKGTKEFKNCWKDATFEECATLLKSLTIIHHIHK